MNVYPVTLPRLKCHFIFCGKYRTCDNIMVSPVPRLNATVAVYKARVY